MTDTVAVDAIVRQEPQTQALAPQSLTPAQMLSIAVQQDAPVEKIEKLMDLQQRWEANEARKAFEMAMVAFSAKVPTIIKTRVVDFTTSKGRTYYTHAGLPETVEQIQGLMAECQLSRRWKDEEPKKPGNIRIRCIVSHITGHSESFSAEAPPDESGNKNAAQAVASIITYLRRTTLFAVLGLVANDEVDDDGAGGKKTEPPKPQSQAAIAEDETRKRFWNLAQNKADVKFTAEQVRAIFAKVQSLSGKTAAIDCLVWLRSDKVLLATDGTIAVQTDGQAGTKGGATDPTDGEPAWDQASADSPGSPPAPSSGGPAPNPPVSALPFACPVCGETYKVLPAGGKCHRVDGVKCAGAVVPVKE